MRGRRYAATIGGVLAALLLAACGGGTATTAGTTSEAPASAAASSTAVTPTPQESTPTAEPTKELRSGSERQADGTLLVTDTDLGYQITVPRGYVKINNRDQLKKIARAGSKALKGQASSLAATAFSKNVKLFAVNKLTGATVSVLTTPSGGAYSEDLPDQAPAIKALLKRQTGAKSVRTKQITVDGDPALQASSAFRINGFSLQMTQVYAISGDTMFVVTVGGPAVPEKTVTTVVRSLHFI